MARQDYVSHSPKNKKKSYAKKSQAQAQPIFNFKAKLVILFTLCAIAGFIYFLWSIKDTKPVKSQKAEKAKKEVVLPKPPTEKWDYINELAEKEVEESEYEVEQGGPYKLQCGSFKTAKQADVLKANIAFAGLTAQINSSVAKSGTTWHKVFLGPYKRKRQAEHDKNLLRRNSINGCKIWLWQ